MASHHSHHHRSHKHKSKPQWAITEKALLKVVRKNLPKPYTARVFEVISGDSGKKYWVQLIHRQHVKARITLCNCRSGYFKAPLTLSGLKKHYCKHIQFVRQWLKDRKGTHHDKEH